MGEKLVDHSAKIGAYMLERLRKIKSPFIKEAGGMGLWAGVEFYKNHLTARTVCEKMSEKGYFPKIPTQRLFV